jgi:hypothetical protein
MMSSMSAPGKNKQNLSRAVFPWARLRGLDGHLTQLATRRSSSFLQHYLAGLLAGEVVLRGDTGQR